MPTIKQAVQSNESMIAKAGGLVPPAQAPPSSGQGMFPVSDIRGGLPSRGSYPPNIILATDFERATGGSNNYGRYRSRTLLASTHPLLAID